MKKLLAALLAATLVMVPLSACNQDQPSGSTAQEQPQEEAQADDAEQDGDTAEAPQAVAMEGDPIDLVFATMDVGTAIYTYSSTMANFMTGYLPAGSTIDLPTTSPGGLGAGYVIENGKSDMIILNDVGVVWSMDTGVLDNPPIEDGVISALVCGLDMPHVAVLFREDFISKSGCESMENLVANQVSANFVIKTAGTLGEAVFGEMLAALGTSEEEIKSWGCTVTRTSTDNIKSAMQDGTADIQIDHLPDNQANTVEMTMNTDCRLIPLSESTRDAMADHGWTKTVWAAGESGFYGHDSDVATVSSSNVLVCRSDLDEEVAYQLTKAVCENKAALESTTSALSVFDPETAWMTLEDILHPGAVRYYQEMGYMS